MRTSEHKDRSDHCQTAPLCLTPSPFSRRLFQQAINVQHAMNLLYYRVSLDTDFLLTAHREVVKTDEYIRRMVEILQCVVGEGVKQKCVLLTQRADYMCHQRGDGSE